MILLSIHRLHLFGRLLSILYTGNTSSMGKTSSFFDFLSKHTTVDDDNFEEVELVNSEILGCDPSAVT